MCVCVLDLSIKSLVFPSETSNSYAELVPLKPLSLNAFTLCMRVATELKGEREIILFAYRTHDYDALNVWREKDGRYAGGREGSLGLNTISRTNSLIPYQHTIIDVVFKI